MAEYMDMDETPQERRRRRKEAKRLELEEAKRRKERIVRQKAWKAGLWLMILMFAFFAIIICTAWLIGSETDIWRSVAIFANAMFGMAAGAAAVKL